VDKALESLLMFFKKISASFFTGRVEINFNQGLPTAIKKIQNIEKVNLKKF